MSWDIERMVGLLLEAGGIARERKKTLAREFKADASIVTQADREVEALLSRALEDNANGVYIIGEETVGEKGEEYIQRALAGSCYVIDPIDGTSPYAYGLPNWGVSVGYMEAGSLVDGAVYLPEYGEMVLSDGDGVRQGRLDGERWEWLPLPEPRSSFDESNLIAITQGVAKRGEITLRNPVQVLGAAVVPLVGLIQGRFRAYLGSVKLWDAAGALPLILRFGRFLVTVEEGDEIREVGREVSERIYHLEPGDPRRWAFRSNLQICHREEAEMMRAALFMKAPRIG